MADEQIIIRYYLDQARNGQTSFYSGPIYQKGGQRGNGIGSFLGGLFRHILPVLRKGTVAIGKEIIKGSSNFARDIGNNIDPQTALKNRATEGLTNLAKKAMGGDGYKRPAVTRKRHCTGSGRPGNVKRLRISAKKPPLKKKSTKSNKKKKAVKKTRDIFCK